MTLHNLDFRQSTPNVGCDFEMLLDTYDSLLNTLRNFSEYTDIPPIIVNGSDVTLQFDTGGKEPRAAGFHLLYNVFRWAENGACADNEFLCDLNL